MATVPIVTEVTKAQLDALVAEEGLNEGLQYKVTDKGWLLIATGSNTYFFTNNVPYKVYAGFFNQSGTDAPSVNIIENSIGNIVWTRNVTGNYIGTLIGAFPENQFRDDTKVFFNSAEGSLFIARWTRNTDDEIMLDVRINGTYALMDDMLINEFIELRVYQA